MIGKAFDLLKSIPKLIVLLNFINPFIIIPLRNLNATKGGTDNITKMCNNIIYTSTLHHSLLKIKV